MPSTYDSLLRLELQATGENATTWGIKTNNNINLLANSVAGAATVNVAGSGDYTLTTVDGLPDEARQAILIFTGLLTGNRNVIVPTSAKNYVVKNGTTGSFTLTVKTAAGSGIVIPTGYNATIFCDGTNVVAAGAPYNAATSAIAGTATGNVAKAGDTMTGDLIIAKASPVITLNKAESGQNALLVSQTAGSSRWAVVVGDSTTETSSADGSNFGINSYSNAGAYIATPFSISRASGVVSFTAIPEGPASNPTTDNQFARKAYVDTKAPTASPSFTGLISTTIAATGLLTSLSESANSITQNTGSDGLSIYTGTFTNHAFRLITNNTTRLTIAAAGAVAVAGDLQFNSGYGSAATAYGCRAWVNFNGTGTLAIRSSGNVTSVTDNGTGKFTVNFTTNMPDVNYCVQATTSKLLGNEDSVTVGYVSNDNPPTVSAVQIYVTETNYVTSFMSDPEWGNVAIFR